MAPHVIDPTKTPTM